MEDCGSHFWIKLVDTKTKKDRSFIITAGDIQNLNFLQIVRKYMSLRPAKTTHTRFFLNYVKQKCTVQPVGVHKIASVPSIVAKFLNLEKPELYTGHCFRRTSATVLANSGASMEGLKRHGGWRSSSVVEGYIDESECTKIEVAEKIFGHANKNVVAAHSNSSLEVPAEHLKDIPAEGSGISLINNKNCTIHINFYQK